MSFPSRTREHALGMISLPPNKDVTAAPQLPHASKMLPPKVTDCQPANFSIRFLPPSLVRVGSIAVAVWAFVEKVKSDLGSKALHREALQAGGAYVAGGEAKLMRVNLPQEVMR